MYKTFDHFNIDFHHIVGVSNIGMTLDCSNSKCYGVFPVPEEAAKLIKDKPYPYRLKVNHNLPSLWAINPDFHPNPEDFENLKKSLSRLVKIKKLNGVIQIFNVIIVVNILIQLMTSLKMMIYSLFVWMDMMNINIQIIAHLVFKNYTSVMMQKLLLQKEML